MDTQGWQFWIDRGGTFTDIVALAPDGAMRTAKLLSADPSQRLDAAVLGMRRLLGVRPDQPFPADRVAAIRMGTTVATNALLERRGAPTVLAITRGLGDALAIGNQSRPKLFDLAISLPPPLYGDVIEIDERLRADGTVLRPLDEGQARQALAQAHAAGYRALAIVLMHGYRHPSHERALAALAREIGFDMIATSHQSDPLMKLVPRGQTTVANAYLTPILHRYVKDMEQAVAGAPLYFMQSSGGLTRADAFEGKDAVLSGPAGGVIGAIAAAQAAGFDKLIGFDMGGTSTDVMHFAGSLERADEVSVAGTRLRVPMLAIHTVAAGGGSILGLSDGRIHVGPASAGADPGPACYGRGGPLAVTDCHVLLGRLAADHFPHLFGPSGDAPLDEAATQAAFTDRQQALRLATGQALSREQIAEGYLDIAVELMARAIKAISVERGHDIRGHVLVAFGGAGGQLACRVAASLGMRRVLIHPLSGLLSALGIGLAAQSHSIEQALELPLVSESDTALATARDRLAQTATAKLQQQGAKDPIAVDCRAHIKYAGADSTLDVPFAATEAMRATFEARHRRRFGFAEPARAAVIERLELTASAGGNALPDFVPPASGACAPVDQRPMWVAGGWRQVPFYARRNLGQDNLVSGPAVILEDHATIVVEPGWQARVDTAANLILEQIGDNAGLAADTALDPILLELFNHRFMSIAEQMGGVLAQTAHSVNIKERLDFSCAIFDAAGQLVANAPHMPVHLGSMSETVEALIRAHPTLRPGDAFALNDPYHGGTHLPDITVISPVFLAGAPRPIFYVAARGHHADIGGITPGSMPADSTDIAQEGIRFEAFALLRDGQFQEAALRAHLGQGPWPARAPDQNIADLRAQLAANARGINELTRMCEEFGADVVTAYMGHIQHAAEHAVRRAIGALSDGDCSYRMDNGAVIRLRLRVDPVARSAEIDFTGTSNQGTHNFNAPLAITRAAVLYALRCLVDQDIPLNAGCLVPIRLIVPEGSILNPRPPAAVVAGNVETSQAVTNALFLAMGVAAASQGTMNNLSFGNDRHQYYETLAGGTGAGPGFDGADAVHSHMTNSRLTDPEVLEWRYPVLVENFGIRRGSGGQGRHQGGAGLVRDLRFLEAMSAAILSNHRAAGPPGLAGGGNGKPGINRVLHADGHAQALPASAAIDLMPGDRLIIETPGGGGYGKPTTRS
ncbi:MAG: hydantoinase B/oxoprolinase family protein [Sphingomonadales bacterium]